MRARALSIRVCTRIRHAFASPFRALSGCWNPLKVGHPDPRYGHEHGGMCYELRPEPEAVACSMPAPSVLASILSAPPALIIGIALGLGNHYSVRVLPDGMLIQGAKRWVMHTGHIYTHLVKREYPRFG